MRNDPATGKGNFKKELAQDAGGVLLKFIKPSDPQNTTYKWTPSDTQDIIKNDKYEVEPENSWFSKYEFKLLTDTNGEGCTLIIRHSDTDQVIINDPKHENTITTIKNFLEDLTGVNINSISYPHGSYNHNVIKEAELSNYEKGASSIFGSIRYNTNKFLIPRIDIWSNDTIKTVKQKINGYWNWLNIINKIKGK